MKDEYKKQIVQNNLRPLNQWKTYQNMTPNLKAAIFFAMEKAIEENAFYIDTEIKQKVFLPVKRDDDANPIYQQSDYERGYNEACLKVHTILKQYREV